MTSVRDDPAVLRLRTEPTPGAQRLIDDYAARTRRSRERFAEAFTVLPGGETRAVTSYPPHPVAITRGEGARLVDADGNTYLDVVNNYTSLVHGNALPPAVAAVRDLLGRGFAFAGPHELQIGLARRLVDRLPSVQRVRFTNSGTEAALLAVRIAVRATGRPRILMFEGGYHGAATPVLRGDAGVVTVPWDDLDAVAAALAADPGIGAVFTEPFLANAGVLQPAEGFVAAVAGLARDHGALVVLDEVQSLRNGPQGEQGRLGVTPDLTLLGKIIGGGFPIGAVGGRADLMELTSAFLQPDRPVVHAGTFNGHLAAAAAGAVHLDLLTAAAIDDLNAAGERLVAAIGRGLDAAGLPGHVTRGGSILHVHLDSVHRQAALHLALLLDGVYATPRGMLNLSTALTAADIDTVGDRYGSALARVATC
ncbi:aspartate aminotransferase family protein [Pseudonocardia alni]|uniref:aspartate aminotransferase family protein n=1 Tax=Pseudonocardia alni TaxID=33907 RepID=UPI0033E1DA82